MAGIILEDLDWADPYSATIVGMKRLVRWGLDNEGSMSDEEYEDLKAIEEFIRTRGNI